MVTGLIIIARLFVAPLRYGAGLKGKVGQSMGFGLPVITTSIGAEGMDLVDGTDILIGDTPEDFARKVIQLYRDEELWAKVSANSTKYVAENYEREVVRSKMWDILSRHSLSLDVSGHGTGVKPS